MLCGDWLHFEKVSYTDSSIMDRVSLTAYVCGTFLSVWPTGVLQHAPCLGGLVDGMYRYVNSLLWFLMGMNFVSLCRWWGILEEAACREEKGSVLDCLHPIPAGVADDVTRLESHIPGYSIWLSYM